MSGYADPFSGFFGSPYPMLWVCWVGFIALLMGIIFVGFDNGGFLHKLEERFNIRKEPHDEEHLDY
jgi:hypothetical protein